MEKCRFGGIFEGLRNGAKLELLADFVAANFLIGVQRTL